ncbi:MAG: glucose 1-dehydrogenase [Ignavibacteria bacterium]|jgi:threonine dehydrogenase-like Zn-dependent dehydrogenase|nr:glucose 1-dehydrogenase [Ignavibacteria bacterium]MCU7504975.1 glucose 1-dehydrogenase [Ignavibacteria bacterium]MCU7514891.1 glucose 1-dehydrogenase [Ignavibacteria bacterium]
MKAIAITPGKGNPEIIELPEPKITNPNQVKLQVLNVGICGTDREEVSGGRAEAASGHEKLVIGHEMLGRVVETGTSVASVKEGDYALFMVRRPCGKCYPCGHMRSDMCYTGEYTERGIKGRDGYQAEFVVDEEEFIVNVPDEIRHIGVLTEPMSVVEKAIDESLNLQAARLPEADFSSNGWLKDRFALVAGLGPIGLLASAILLLRGAEVYGLDIVDENSHRPSLLKELGGKYIDGRKLETAKIDEKYHPMDIIVEATGIAKLEFELINVLAINGIYVLTGIPGGERPVSILGSEMMRRMVLMNQVVLGSVNASIRHYRMAIDDLTEANLKWPDAMSQLITHKVKYTNFESLLGKHSPDEIKAVIVWNEF